MRASRTDETGIVQIALKMIGRSWGWHMYLIYIDIHSNLCRNINVHRGAE